MGDECDQRARQKLGVVSFLIRLGAVLLVAVLIFQSLRVAFAGGADARRWKPNKKDSRKYFGSMLSN